jgi:SsrA-binding protein
MEKGVRIVAQNRRATFDYHVEDKMEAGLQLLGSEVKSLRAGEANLSDAYAAPKGKELFLVNAHIAPYGRAASAYGHEPLRPRKLLMHRAEMDRWMAQTRERGFTIIPLSLYFKNGRAKVELGLCKGKDHGDRRQDIKMRDSKREMDRAIRRR